MSQLTEEQLSLKESLARTFLEIASKILPGDLPAEGDGPVRAVPRDATERDPCHEQSQPQPRGDSDDPEERICSPGGVYRVPAVRAQRPGGGQDVRQGQGR